MSQPGSCEGGKVAFGPNAVCRRIGGVHNGSRPADRERQAENGLSVGCDGIREDQLRLQNAMSDLIDETPKEHKLDQRGGIEAEPEFSPE